MRLHHTLMARAHGDLHELDLRSYFVCRRHLPSSCRSPAAADIVATVGKIALFDFTEDSISRQAEVSPAGQARSLMIVLPFAKPFGS